MSYRRRLSAAAFFLLASAIFTALMAWTTDTREQEAWAVSAALLAAPGLTLGIFWLLDTARSTRHE